MNRNNPFGEKAHHWKGGRSRNGEYITIYKPDHPFGYQRHVMEHRAVWEEHNKAMLLPWIEIHHINGIKTDNRIENLIPIGTGKHVELHLQEKRINDINKRSCGLCGNGTWIKKMKAIRPYGKGYYEYDSAQWFKNPINKSQLVCRKCFRAIMKKEFGKRV